MTHPGGALKPSDIRTPATGTGIVCFRHSATESHVIVRRLKEKGMIAAPRQGWVRMAPHFYVGPKEINQVLDQL